MAAFHAGAAGSAASAFAGEPLGTFTPAMRATEARCWRQDRLAPASGARKISDFLTTREWHSQELYVEVARPLRVEHMMRLWIRPAPDGGTRLELDRAGRDFTERDRAVLDVLLPHLQQACRPQRGDLGDVARSRSSDAVTTREQEILALVAEGHTNAQIGRALWLSPGTVRKHLENAYAKLGVHTRTGAVAELAARRNAARASPGARELR